MNTKVIASLMVIGLVSVVAGAGTFAYFSDTETSTGNTFTAGTLNLKYGEDDPASTIITVSDVKPGEDGRVVADLKNTGSITEGLYLVALSNSLSESSETEPSESSLQHDVSANEFGSAIKITYFSYLIDTDGDGILMENGAGPDNGKACPESGYTAPANNGIDDDDECPAFYNGPGISWVPSANPGSEDSWDAWDSLGNGNGHSDLYDWSQSYGSMGTWDGDGIFVLDWKFVDHPANNMGNVDGTGISDDNDFQADGVEFDLGFKLWQLS